MLNVHGQVRRRMKCKLVFQMLYIIVMEIFIDVINKKDKKKFVFKPRVECANISSHLVQITCSSEEINRRINMFINRKREQVNQSNVRDFCGLASVENSCARVDSKLIRSKNTKSHLRSK